MPAETVNIVRIKFKSIECEGYSGPKGEMRNENKMFFLETPRTRGDLRKWEDNIKIYRSVKELRLCTELDYGANSGIL